MNTDVTAYFSTAWWRYIDRYACLHWLDMHDRQTRVLKPMSKIILFKPQCCICCPHTCVIRVGLFGGHQHQSTKAINVDKAQWLSLSGQLQYPAKIRFNYVLVKHQLNHSVCMSHLGKSVSYSPRVVFFWTFMVSSALVCKLKTKKMKLTNH